MTDRPLTGVGLGSSSAEDDGPPAQAPRCAVTFECPRQHHFTVVLAQTAELPILWACPRCCTDGFRTLVQCPPVLAAPQLRSHWDLLRDRRSPLELEALLAERLQLLQDGQIGPRTARETP